MKRLFVLAAMLAMTMSIPAYAQQRELTIGALAHVPSQIMIGHSEPYPLWVYLMESATAFLLVAVIVYLIKRY